MALDESLLMAAYQPMFAVPMNMGNGEPDYFNADINGTEIDDALQLLRGISSERV